ncbi:MAG TPA: type II toxin-antitoxin system HicB family antitoxin [Methylotenera sp.]|nr:type II toxin-antitoxin system HicB family antitoxin [Methylotenera sp.]
MAELNHKGYTGSAEVSFQDNCLHGRILFIDDVITFEGNTTEELLAAFKDAVDDYISYCEKTGKAPNRPYSGVFNVRVGQDLHREAAEMAYMSGASLNDFVSKAIAEKISRNGISKVEHTHNHLVTVIGDNAPEYVTVTANETQKWEFVNATTRH